MRGAQGTAWTGKPGALENQGPPIARGGLGQVDWDPNLYPLNTTGVVYFSHWVLQVLLFSML